MRRLVAARFVWKRLCDLAATSCRLPKRRLVAALLSKINAKTIKHDLPLPKLRSQVRASGWASVPSAASGIRWLRNASSAPGRAQADGLSVYASRRRLLTPRSNRRTTCAYLPALPNSIAFWVAALYRGPWFCWAAIQESARAPCCLQVADKLSSRGTIVLYVSGEESERQIKLRGERLGVQAPNLLLLPETNLENIFREIERLQPGAIIVDSIQTTFSSEIESAPGSISQIREVAAQFLLLAKTNGTPVFLIGHVTKEGSIAGSARPGTHCRHGPVF